MRKIFALRIIATLVLFPVLITVGCQQQPAPPPPLTSAPPQPVPSPTQTPPEPTPTPPPVPVPTPSPVLPPPPSPDEPNLTEEQVCSYAWTSLPPELPDGYLKSEFLADTGKATYKGKGDWEFVLLGSGRQEWPTPSWEQAGEILEKTPGNWVEQQSKKVTTYELSLTGVFNEETKTLEIMGIEKFNEKLTTEVIETLIQKALFVHWIRGEYIGSEYLLEGSVENVGELPLENIQVKFSLFAEGLKLLETKTTTLEPEIINPGERGRYFFRFYLREEARSYLYLFTTASGQRFSRVTDDLLVLR